MMHYDSSYEHDAKENNKAQKKLVRSQLKMMEKFILDLSVIGEEGISQRHIDHFDDMMNETKARL